MRYYLLVYILFTLLSLALILYVTIVNYMKKNTYILDSSQKHRNNFHHKKENHHKKMIHRCNEKCSQDICNSYQEKLNNFANCQLCRLENKCYSLPQNECIKCSEKDLDQPCTEQYGCQNPKGYMRHNVPPINPANTKCQPCWENENNIVFDENT